MDDHGSGLSRVGPRPTRRNPRHRIADSSLLRGDTLPAAAFIDRKESTSCRSSLRTGRQRLGQEEARRQRVGIDESKAFTTGDTESHRAIPHVPLWNSVAPLVRVFQSYESRDYFAVTVQPPTASGAILRASLDSPSRSPSPSSAR